MHEKMYNRARNLPVFFKPELVCVHGALFCCAELADQALEAALPWWRCVLLGACLPSLVPICVFFKLTWFVPAQRTIRFIPLHVTDPSKLRIIKNLYSWPLNVLFYHSL